MDSIADQKTALRKQMLARRMEMPELDWINKSKAVTSHVLESEQYINSTTIHCFVSMNKRREVDTHSLLKTMLDDRKKVIISSTNFADGTLNQHSLEDFSALKENKWGVLEPVNSPTTGISNLDLILVPLLAADLKGNRLGYGKGFYDRFLSKVTALAFGLIFDDFILDQIPVDSFDKKLNGLISESGVKVL